MRNSKVVVPWREGLHLRHAVKLVQLSKFFHSTISLRHGPKIANLRSIISIISLCATMGTALDVEASGDDEVEATRAVERAFLAHLSNPQSGNSIRQENTTDNNSIS